MAKVRVKGLRKDFGSLEVLRGIDLEVREGEVVCMIGPSGSGKSTFLRCLNFLETPTGGEVEVDGYLLTDGKTDLNKIRENIGMVFQQFNLFPHLTVTGNITMAPLDRKKLDKPAAEKKARELLERVGLADKADAYPAQLSGGQQQRVAIARALATSPEVLLCDEPTSALDSLTTKNILELLHNINRKLNVTIVIITHEIAVVKAICNKVAVIDTAEFVEWGDTAEIFKNPRSDMTRLLLGYEVMKK